MIVPTGETLDKHVFKFSSYYLLFKWPDFEEISEEKLLGSFTQSKSTN